MIISAIPSVLEQIPVKLIVIGEGNYEKKLRQLVQKLDIGDRVTFLGLVPREKLTGYYNACGLFVLPTLEQESLPLALLEAMACEKPVVTSEIIELPSVQENKTSGIILKEYSFKKSVNEIETLFMQVVK